MTPDAAVEILDLYLASCDQADADALEGAEHDKGHEAGLAEGHREGFAEGYAQAIDDARRDIGSDPAGLTVEAVLDILDGLVL